MAAHATLSFRGVSALALLLGVLWLWPPLALAQADPSRPEDAPAGTPAETPPHPLSLEQPQQGAGEEQRSRAVRLGERMIEAAWESIQGQRIVLGAAYEQGTMKFPNFRGEAGEMPTITDNGRLAPVVHYETEEQYFARFPLITGQAALGYNLAASYASIETDRELLTSAVVGDDVGTAVTGDYLVLVPSVFMRLGPLYAERSVFWKFAVGLGLGLVRFDGTVQPHLGESDAPPKQTVTTEGTVPAPVITVGWELQVERWLLVFRSVYFQGDAGGDRFTYELYSLGLAYTVRF